MKITKVLKGGYIKPSYEKQLKEAVILNRIIKKLSQYKRK